MRKLFVLMTAVVLSGCSTFNHRIVSWPDGSETGMRTADGQYVQVIGNPRITCYNKQGSKLAEGLFVRIEDDHCSGDCTFLVVDEFGKDYVRVRNDQQNYCILWNGK